MSDLTAARGIWYNLRCSVNAAKVATAGLWRGGEKSNAPRNNVASKLQVVQPKYVQYFDLFLRFESRTTCKRRCAQLGAFLFVYSIRAFGRALAECMDGSALFFMHRIWCSTIIWRAQQKG